jgi:hypothetical protein
MVETFSTGSSGNCRIPAITEGFGNPLVAFGHQKTSATRRKFIPTSVAEFVRILLACIQSEDEGLIDEIHHALDIRSKLEDELTKRPKLEKYRRDIESVDKALRVQRKQLLEILGDGMQHYRSTYSPPLTESSHRAVYHSDAMKNPTCWIH